MNNLTDEPQISYQGFKRTANPADYTTYSWRATFGATYKFQARGPGLPPEFRPRTRRFFVSRPQSRSPVFGNATDNTVKRLSHRPPCWGRLRGIHGPRLNVAIRFVIISAFRAPPPFQSL